MNGTVDKIAFEDMKYLYKTEENVVEINAIQEQKRIQPYTYLWYNESIQQTQKSGHNTHNI